MKNARTMFSNDCFHKTHRRKSICFLFPFSRTYIIGNSPQKFTFSMHFTENISQNQIKYYRILKVLRALKKNFGIWKNRQFLQNHFR